MKLVSKDTCVRLKRFPGLCSTGPMASAWHAQTAMYTETGFTAPRTAGSFSLAHPVPLSKTTLYGLELTLNSEAL